MTSNSLPESAQLQRGLRVSLISILWTVIASAITIVVGLTRGSLVLTAFGFTGALDAAGSTALVVHFRHALKHDAFSDAREKIALLVITIGLVVVALATVGSSIERLATGGEPQHSVLGLAVAGTSIVMLGILAGVKRRIGKALPSPALVADSLLSATGSLLALVTVCGTVLTTAGFWWADPFAAIAVAIGALVIVGVLHTKGEPVM